MRHFLKKILMFRIGQKAAEAVAEIALVDGAARELMRDLQRGGGVGGADAEAQDGGRGDRGGEYVAACKHECLPSRCS